METNEAIEMMLWEYMDGTCSMSDMQRISVLIERDEVWKQKYAELSSFQTELSTNLRLEQPSLRFSKNVMEVVATVNIAPATKKYINKNIIKGIAAFFIITITTLLCYAFATADWSSGSIGSSSRFNLDNFHFSNYFNSSTLNIFIAINVALGLVLLDSFLRRRKRSTRMHKFFSQASKYD